MQFYEWLPLPNIFHPFGTLNLLAHAPENASAPDLCPEIYTSWETDAATASMPLQSTSACCRTGSIRITLD